MTALLEKTLIAPASVMSADAILAKFGPLTALDRCDANAAKMNADKNLVQGQCGAQAFVRAVMPSGFDLLFCAHHADKQTANLIAKGASLYDGTLKINKQASQSSA